MIRTYVLGVTLGSLLTLTACGGGSDGGDDLGQAFCTDLADGLSLFQLYEPVADQYEPQEFAGRAFVWAEDACPDQLASNDGLRGYLEAWNVDPDG